MRITSFIIFDQLTRSLQRNMRILSKYSDRLSTGKKINKPSEDVAGGARALDYKVKLNENEQYMKNIDDAYSYLDFSDTVMSSISSSLTRAKELAIEAANGTQSAETRYTIAAEIGNLRDEVFNYSNSRFRDRYVFSGYSTDTPAFDSGYNYQGDSGEIDVMVGRNSTIAANIPGNAALSYGGNTFAKILDNFRIALENNDEAEIQMAITNIEGMLEQTANVRALFGARLAYLEKQKINLEDMNYSLKMFLSDTEDADIAETVSELAKTEVTLQSLRASGSEMLSQSLLDFLG